MKSAGRRPRAAVVYSYRPSGHARAAQALSEALHAQGWGKSTELAVSGDLHPVLGPLVARAYVELLKKTPEVWEALYDNEAVARATEDIRALVHLVQGFKLKERLRSLKPDLVIATHALACGSAAALKKRGELDAALAAVPTDYAVHRYWRSPEVDLYLVPTAEAAESLKRAGVPAERIAETGLPVLPYFEAPESKSRAREALGLEPNRPTVLLSGGSRGLGPLLETLEALRAGSPQAQFLLLCGENAGLLKDARSRFAGRPRVRVFGFLQKAERAVRAADVLVGKAGGITLAEALAAGTVPLIYDPMPGQERRNADHLLARGAALKAGSLADLGAKLRTLLRDSPERRAALEAGGKVGRPFAARRAAEALEGLLERAASSRGR